MYYIQRLLFWTIGSVLYLYLSFVLLIKVSIDMLHVKIIYSIYDFMKIMDMNFRSKFSNFTFIANPVHMKEFVFPKCYMWMKVYLLNSESQKPEFWVLEIFFLLFRFLSFGNTFFVTFVADQKVYVDE